MTMNSVPTFVELRALALQSARPATSPADNLFVAARQELNAPAGPVSISALHLDGGSGRVDALTADEFVLVLTGALSIAGRRVLRDESIVIPGGRPFDWKADPGTLAIVMGCISETPGGTEPIVIDTSAELVPSGPPLADLLVGPTPACRNNTDYRSGNGEFTVGTWDSTPYHRRTMPYRHCELMHLLEGAVTFVDGAGRQATFSRGDIFVIEQGAHCAWFSDVDVKKVYAIYRPL